MIALVVVLALGQVHFKLFLSWFALVSVVDAWCLRDNRAELRLSISAERATRVRELFALVLDTPTDMRDALLVAQAGHDPELSERSKSSWLRMRLRNALIGRSHHPVVRRGCSCSTRLAWPLRFQPPTVRRTSIRHHFVALGTLRPYWPCVRPVCRSIPRWSTPLRPSSLDHPTIIHQLQRWPRGARPRGKSHIPLHRVQALLGAGGMGVVYSARDMALGRMAALEVLPNVFTPDLRERLLLEADASSRLQHPAIATYYESGEVGGTAFIAMELVAGATLRHRLSHGPAIEVDDALAWTACVLEALSHAHAVGILHRDIKPENIMLTGRQSAKLLDFGLAKHLLLENAATAATAHTAGAVAGTLGHMSPEQIRNDPQDGRSDVFQVGAVLYEMLSGRPAFPGSSPAERPIAVLARDPEPIATPGVAAPLSAAVMRSFPRPARRYPSAAAFLSALRAVNSGEWVVELPDAIAILDFDNHTQNPIHAWIATGIAEALAADLRKVSESRLSPAIESQRCESLVTAASGKTPQPRMGCGWAVDGCSPEVTKWWVKLFA